MNSQIKQLIWPSQACGVMKDFGIFTAILRRLSYRSVISHVPALREDLELRKRLEGKYPRHVYSRYLDF